MTFILRNRTLFLETGKYFGISQNGIEDKKSGTEGVIQTTFRFKSPFSNLVLKKKQ